jgi:hypothetical protein
MEPISTADRSGDQAPPIAAVAALPGREPAHGEREGMRIVDRKGSACTEQNNGITAKAREFTGVPSHSTARSSRCEQDGEVRHPEQLARYRSPGCAVVVSITGQPIAARAGRSAPTRRQTDVGGRPVPVSGLRASTDHHGETPRRAGAIRSDSGGRLAVHHDSSAAKKGSKSTRPKETPPAQQLARVPWPQSLH